MSLEILGDGFDLHARWRRPRLPAPRERACAGGGRRPPVRAALGAQRDGDGRRRQDVEVAEELHHARRGARRARSPRVPARGAADALSLAAGARSRRAHGGGAGARPARRPRPEVGTRGCRRRAADPETVAAFRAAMDDDFGTPAAVGVIFDAVRNANAAIDARDLQRAAALVAAVRELADVVGLELRASEDADDEIDALVAQRVEARAAGDYAEADRIRDELAARGDHPRGRTRRNHLAPMTKPSGRPKPARPGPPRRRDRASAGRDGLGGGQVEGRRAVRELLRAGRRRVRRTRALDRARRRSAARRDRRPRRRCPAARSSTCPGPSSTSSPAPRRPRGSWRRPIPVPEADVDRLLARPDAVRRRPRRRHRPREPRRGDPHRRDRRRDGSRAAAPPGRGALAGRGEGGVRRDRVPPDRAGRRDPGVPRPRDARRPLDRRSRRAGHDLGVRPGRGRGTGGRSCSAPRAVGSRGSRANGARSSPRSRCAARWTR